jgi:hypothetical protein
MNRSCRLLIVAWLIMMPVGGSLAPPASPIAAAGADERCGEDEEGDYRTRMPNSGGAEFLWRGADRKLQASVTLLQDKCVCTDHETIVDPVTGEERQGACTERTWREQATFDTSRSPVWETDLAFEKPRLRQLGANASWEKICPAPWHDTRGVIQPDADGLEYDFRGSNQEEYHVWAYIFARGGVRHQDGRSHCEPNTLSRVTTNVHDKAMRQLALRSEERFDIDATVRAAVAGLPYDQVRVRVNPAYDAANPNATGLVGLGSYFWLEGADQPPFSGFRVPVAGWGGRRLSAWVVVYPSSITWSFGDGTTLATTSRGLPWPMAEVAEGTPRPEAVVKVYQADGVYPVTVQVEWAARWGLYEENTTLCSVSPPTVCSPFIPIYTAGPASSAQTQAYKVRQAQAIGVYLPAAPRP